MRSKKVLILKLGQLIKFYIRKLFIEKFVENVHQKLFPDFSLILENIKPKIWCTNTFKKLFYEWDILEDGYQKSSRNLTSFLFLNPVTSSGDYRQNKRGLEVQL